jgi:DNA-binding MurR/RpiR family transcriptional regulator
MSDASGGPGAGEAPCPPPANGPERPIAAELRSGIGRFPPSERRAAQTLLSHYPLAGLEPLADFASRAGVSAPSVLRFIARLGFSSYADFQRRLRQELEARLASPLAKGEAQPSEVGPAARFLGAAGDNLRATLEAVSEEDFDGITALLAHPRRRIHLVGGRFTDPLAQYLANHLRVLRPAVSHVGGQPAGWPELVVDMDRSDVLVCFDIRRYQDDVIELAEAAARRKAAVVLFTDQWLSPIAKVARHVVAARVRVPSNWDSSCALLAMAEAILAAVTERVWASARPRMQEIEALRRKRGG